ncbi:MAG: hypothetical protein IJH73_05720 [Lachnospiraceae bacterium]|nr:hypothetical protein [Lachnospiraceae bacterium]
MELVPAKCTECGAILQVDPSKDAWICDHCGTPFIVEKGIQMMTVAVVPGAAMANKLFEDAEAFLSFGDYGQAFTAFGKMTTEFPRDWRGWFGITRALCGRWLKQGYYSESGGNPPYEAEALRRALTLNPDAGAYIPFFTGILNRVEQNTHLALKPMQALGRGYQEYQCENYPAPTPLWQDYNYIWMNKLVGSAGTYYQPSGLFCWFVMEGGPGQMIRMLNDAGLTARADALISAFKNGFLNGSFAGKDFQWMPELFDLAKQRTAHLANDPKLLCGLFKQAGIKARYDRRSAPYRAYDLRSAWGWEKTMKNTEAVLIGRTLLIREFGYDDSFYCFILSTPASV